MADKKRIIMAGATLVCIGAIGFFMQNGQKGQGVRAPQAPVSAAGLNAGPTPGLNGMPEPVKVSEISLTAADNEILEKPSAPLAAKPALPQVAEPAVNEPATVKQPVSAEQPVASEEPETAETPVVLKIATEDAADDMVNQPVETPETVSLLDDAAITPPVVADTRNEPDLAAQCDITMTGTEVAGALVKLSLSAACLPNERVTILHSNMMFTESTDDKGKLDIAVPALTENAVFIASFANSDGAVANVNVTTLDLYDRAVVQSEFFSSIGLHALEFGAGYEDGGHIWANSPGDIAAAATGKGGFLTLLGNPAISEGTMAQVYTFPTGLAEQAGDIEISTEIEVTNMNCGHEIEAQALQVQSEGRPKVQTLNLTMPDCDAVGDFLVLKNLLNDLKVAANTQ
ncbi:translocase [Marimonas arenosa]|uniref:Translocase n=1 Tax=Marimonas arenosa TaxID=1795305 RepID=A0AAE3WER9_9RHOB|nr:translocase [Marimonas arenosa]MDQ2090377.1 translocase [Marimonas arenosa]